jgi:hypothetical protein
LAKNKQNWRNEIAALRDVDPAYETDEIAWIINLLSELCAEHRFAPAR